MGMIGMIGMIGMMAIWDWGKNTRDSLWVFVG